MAKILFGNIVGDARGSVGAITYSRNTAGAYTRQRVSPVQPRTPAQLAARASFSTATQSWGALTQTQRDAWISFAASHPVLDVFNNPVVLSGIAFFTRVIRNLITADLPLLTDPPANFNAVDVGAISTAAANPATLNLVFEELDPVPTDTSLIWDATPGVSQGKTQVGNLFRQLTVLPATTASPFAAGTIYIAKFGTVITDTAIHVRAYTIGANGAAGPRRTAFAIAT